MFMKAIPKYISVVYEDLNGLGAGLIILGSFSHNHHQFKAYESILMKAKGVFCVHTLV